MKKKKSHLKKKLRREREEAMQALAVPVHKRERTPLDEPVEEQVEIFVNEEDEDDIVIRHKNRHTTYMSQKGFMRELALNRVVVEKVITKQEVPVRRTIRIRGAVRNLYRLKDFFAAYLVTDGVKQLQSGPGRPKKERPLNKDDADTRFSMARADKMELDLAMSAEVVHLEDDVIKQVGDMLAAFRARVLSIPAKAAAVIPPEFRSEVEAAIKKITNEALLEIASYRPESATGRVEKRLS
jgi:hypothetical protein